MKRFLNTLLALGFVAQGAVAAQNVSPRIVDLTVSEVGQEGVILKRSHMFPVENVLVGIPTQISTGSVCVEFAGQQNSKRGDIEILDVKGTTDPMIDACIEIYPMPVERILTVDFQVQNELAPAEVTSKVVQINNLLYNVTLDLQTEKVSIKLLPTTRLPKPILFR